MALPKATKKKKARAPSQRVRKGSLQDPSWEGADGWSGKEYHLKRQHATEYYYRNYKASDLVEYAYDWMLANEYTTMYKRMPSLAKFEVPYNANNMKPACAILE